MTLSIPFLFPPSNRIVLSQRLPFTDQRGYLENCVQLQELQHTPREYDEKQEELAIRMHRNFRKQSKDWNPTDFGFVWSTTQLDAMAEHRTILCAAQSNGIIPAKAA